MLEEVSDLEFQKAFMGEVRSGCNQTKTLLGERL